MAAFMPQSVQDVQKAMEAMVEEIQKTYLLPRQKEAFLCCAKCCDTSGGVQQLEGCIQRCSQEPQDTQKMIQQQLGQFQERFQRAAMRCQDEVKDLLPYNAGHSDQAKAQDKFNACMEKSGQEFLQKVPKLRQDIMAALNRF